MNFEDEEYVRVYTRKTAPMSLIGWEGRTVLWHLMLACDARGLLEFARRDDLVEVVCLMTEMPEDVARVGLIRLLDEQLVQREPAGLRIAEFEGRFTNRRSRNWSKIHYPAVYERDGEVCRYCGCGDVDLLSVDHVVPRCQGGADDLGNLVVACLDCNRRKGGRTPTQAGMVLR